jgi:UDP-glucose 4-epimerase
MKTVAVTGTSGFVGRRLMVYDNELFKLLPVTLRNIPIEQLNLKNVDAIIHLAGKAHQMQPIADEVYFEVNYELTKNLAIAAKKQGVKHFIYISSTKVYGDEITEPVSEYSKCVPTDAYGASKLKAEQFLRGLESLDFKIAIIRPPLVYGPQVKGNMIKLLQLAKKKYPLPFRNIKNARSMVYVDNLIELINTIIIKEARGIYIAGDGLPVSTTELVMLIRKHMGYHRYSLFSIPILVRKMIHKIKPALFARLFGSFVADNTNSNNKLNFMPPYSTSQGIAETVKWYIQKK